MDTASIIVTSIFIILIAYKLYSIRKKGIKQAITQKLIVLPIVAIVIGAFMLINPDFELQNPKDMLTSFVSEIIDEKDEQ